MEAVKQLLASKDAEIKKLDRDLQRLQEDRKVALIQREALAQALRALGESVDPLPGVAVKTAVSRRNRTMSHFWINALETMMLNGEMSTGQIMAMGENVSSGSVRSQLALYAEKGLVERVRPGVFQITQAGVDYIQAQKAKDPAATGSEGPATSLVDNEHPRSVDPGDNGGT